MRRAGIGQAVDVVHLGCAERERRRIQPDVALAVGLDETARVAGVRFEMEGARGLGVQGCVGGDFLVGGEADDALRARGASSGGCAVRGLPALRHHERGAAQVADRLDALALG
jgi:hypothetical protein